MTIEIQTEHGVVLLDDDFAHLASRIKIKPADPKKRSYAYAVVGNMGVHRIVVGAHQVSGSVIWVDHINGNGLDNRRCNLRLATPKQNAHNHKKRSDNTSGVKGVCWDKKHERWEVRVKVDGKQKFGGRYESLEDAKKAAEALRKVLHGRFARHD